MDRADIKNIMAKVKKNIAELIYLNKMHYCIFTC